MKKISTALFALGILLLCSTYSEAASIVVDTISDLGSSGVCALRDAITATNTMAVVNGCSAGTGTDTIYFIVSGTITLGSTLPAIVNTLTIDGTGQTITIDGNSLYGVLVVNSGATLTINALAVENGNLLNISGNGGGVHNEGNLNVTNSTFSGNTAQSGGGIYNLGTIVVTNSTFYGNTTPAGPGGGINNTGVMTVTNSTFSNNSGGVAGDAGGIFNEGFGSITNSTFSGNTAPNGYGGGIWNDGTLAVTNCTFSGNLAESSFGGGIYNQSGGTTTVTNSILTASTGGNCYGTITNGGYNISDDTSCSFGSFVAANGDTIGDSVSGGNINLDSGGLANNGGPTDTIALLSPSYAIGAIPSVDCPATDQRLAPRPAPTYSACDVGAFEYGNSSPWPTPTPTATATATATPTATATATPTATPTPIPPPPSCTITGLIINPSTDQPYAYGYVYFNNITIPVQTIGGTTIQPLQFTAHTNASGMLSPPIVLPQGLKICVTMGGPAFPGTLVKIPAVSSDSLSDILTNYQLNVTPSPCAQMF